MQALLIDIQNSMTGISQSRTCESPKTVPMAASPNLAERSLSSRMQDGCRPPCITPAGCRLCRCIRADATSAAIVILAAQSRRMGAAACLGRLLCSASSKLPFCKKQVWLMAQTITETQEACKHRPCWHKTPYEGNVSPAAGSLHML